MKRFAEGKLLVVITDGKKFGNVVSVHCQRVTQQEGDEADEELSRMLMLQGAQMSDGFEDLDEMDRRNGGEEKKVVEDEEEQDQFEYSSTLLLGDRTQQPWLHLFSSSLLQTLLTLPLPLVQGVH